MAPALRQVLLPLALLLPGALAGCLGGDEPVAPAAVPPDAVVVTRPDDNTALGQGDMGWHLHDYWDGQDRHTAADATVETGGWTCDGCERIDLRFRGAPGQLVPLGTAAIEVTLTWTVEGEQRYGAPELWVKRADEREPSLVAPIQNGVPLAFNVTNDEADPPHQVLSRWEYFLMLPAVDEKAQTAGTFRLYAEAIRGLEIPLFPPHPDHWKGQTEIALLEESVGPTFQRENAAEGRRSCNGPCLATHVPQDGAIVPWDATEVVVTLTYGPGLPATLGVRSHGGDTWDMTPAKEEPTGPLTRTFRIPVTETTGDSPYARQSLWEIQVWLDQPTDERAFYGSYTLKAVAVK